MARMDDLLARVARAVTRHGLLAAGDTVVVGVSGGADSLVLLHLLLRLHETLPLTLHVATLDHGLRADSAADAEFVRQTARAWGLPVTVGRADVGGAAAVGQLNLEEAARQVRYAFLLRVARQIGAGRIAVGHHRDDQAETVLMHLIRGSGLNGLRGMLPATPLDAYHLSEDVPLVCDPPLDGAPAAPELWPVLVRPLLDVPRADIDAYAAAHDLAPRQDVTNADTTYFRNRLRHAVIPLLETLNPNLSAGLARTADALRADAEIVAAVGDTALRCVLRAETRDAVLLDRAGFAALGLGEQRHVVRAVVTRLRPDLRDVGFEHVAGALDVIARGETGSQATLPGGLLLRVSYDTLLIAPAGTEFSLLDADAAPALPPDQVIRFEAGERVQQTVGGWVFAAEPLPPGADLAAWHADPLAAALRIDYGITLELRPRRPGDRFRPRGLGAHRQKLSDTLINMRVPAVWRDRVPLLVTQRDQAILWFVAPTLEGTRGRVSDSCAVDADSAGEVIGVRWRRAESRLAL